MNIYDYEGYKTLYCYDFFFNYKPFFGCFVFLNIFRHVFHLIPLFSILIEFRVRRSIAEPFHTEKWLPRYCGVTIARIST